MNSSEFVDSEQRRLRHLLTKHNIFWSIDWPVSQLQAVENTILETYSKVTKTAINSVLLTLFFELLSFDYSPVELFITHGDPFLPESPVLFATTSPTSPIIFWLPEISDSLTVLFSLRPHGKFAIPLAELLALDSPVESTFTLWDSEISGKFRSIDSVRARLRASVQHPPPTVAPQGRSFDAVWEARVAGVPVRASFITVPSNASVAEGQVRSVALPQASSVELMQHATPELVAKLERLRQRVVELGRDNVRLKEILNKRMNVSYLCFVFELI